MVPKGAEREVRKCVHALHVIVARKLLGQAVVSILMKRLRALLNRTVVPVEAINPISTEGMLA
jgi:hypothetical protein